MLVLKTVKNKLNYIMLGCLGWIPLFGNDVNQTKLDDAKHRRRDDVKGQVGAAFVFQQKREIITCFTVL